MEKSKLDPLFYEWIAPFLKILKEKGLPVSPDTHIQVLRVLTLCKEKITHENILNYIAPVIIKNADQLRIVKESYASYLQKHFPPIRKEEAITDEEKKKKEGQERKLQLKRKYLRFTLIGVLVLIAGLIIYIIILPAPASKAKAVISVVRNDHVNTAVEYSGVDGLTNTADTQNLRFTWNFGDGTIDSGNHNVSHKYKKPGKYIVSLKLASASKKVKILQTDTTYEVSVCPPPVYITANAIGDIEIGQPVQFRLTYDSLYPPDVNNTWYVGDSSVLTNSYLLNYVFNSPGPRTIRFSPSKQDSSINCKAGDEMEVNVKEPESFSLSLSQAGKTPDAPPISIRSSWLWALLLLLILPLLILAWIRVRLARKEKLSRSKAKEITNHFAGQEPPFEVPFKPREDLIESEKELVDVARSFKRRSADERMYLDIPQTISSTIRSGGMLMPVWNSKSRPVEFLVLIDNSKAKSQQVRLFEYLLRRFSRNDVYLEKFYFHVDPSVCTNSTFPNGIHLSRLHELYPQHMLLIFGTGYQLIEPGYPALNDSLMQTIMKWNHRAVCTPVRFTDWDYKEKLLQKAATLFPADLKGQLVLFRLLENNVKYEEPLPAAYKDAPETIDFKKADQLKEYLNDNFLFQWLCAIAVYPRIQWDVLVAIGDALQRKNYPGYDINYTSLLKLVRIEWMQDGSFPDRTRLELLKHLEPKNEKLARETMITLMDEAATRIDKSTFSYEHIQMQRLTDKFLLYAHDNTSVKYKEYEKEHEEFKTLWEQGKIHDYPLKTYLEKNTAGGEWNTLINNKELSNSPSVGTPMNNFFSNGVHVIRKKVLQAQSVLLTVASLSLVLLGFLLIAGKNIHGNRIDKALGLTYAHNDIAVTFRMAFNECLANNGMQQNLAQVNIMLPGGDTVRLSNTDSIQTVSLPFSWVRDSMISVSLTSNRFSYSLDSTFGINSDQLSFGLKGCVVSGLACAYGWAPFDPTINDSLAGDWYNESLPTGSDDSYPCMSIGSGHINGNPIVNMYQCVGNASVHKLIVDKGGAYEVIYLEYLGARDKLKMSNARIFTNQQDAVNDTGKIVLNNKVRLAIEGLAGGGFSLDNKGADIWEGASADFTIELKTDKYIVDKTSNFFLNNKQWTVNRTMAASNNLFSNMNKILIQSDKEIKTIYIATLNSSEILLSEEVNLSKGVTQNTIASIGRFDKISRIERLTGGSLTVYTDSLPRLLQEIWGGGTSNRLININLDKTTIYYSTGDKKTYGLYRIEETSLTNGVYKVITRADNQFQVFFFRNVQNNAFELAACENRYSTRDEARKIDPTYCNKFNRMTPYYESDESKLFIPYNISAFATINKDKIDRINDAAINIGQQPVGNITATLYHNSKFGWVAPTRLALVQFSRTVEFDSGTPFDRSYVSYEVGSRRYSVIKNLLYFTGKQVSYVATPNKGGEYVPEYIVIHNTATTSGKASIQWFTNTTSQAATHLLIDRDGTITQLAPFNIVVYHAGKSQWEGKSGLNQYAIGIDLVNAGSLTKTSSGWTASVGGTKIPDSEVMIAKHKNGSQETGWQTYTDAQINAVIEICRTLKATYNIKAIIGHDDIDPQRKLDPGPAFPMDRLK